MAFFQLILTAIKLRELKETLIEEKEESIKLEKKQKGKWKFKHFLIDFQFKLKKCIQRMFCMQDNSRLNRFCFNLRHHGTFENFILKSIVGFISGYILTYIFFIFFVFQLNFSLPVATIFCSVMGSILTIGLAFSSKVRCIVLLTLPQFFSKKGRQALLAYAFILAVTGPGKNTLNNISILSESLACGQEQLKSAVRQIIDLVKKPFYAIKEAIKKVVKTVKEIMKKIKEVLLQIKRIIMGIVKIIKAAFEFLGKILNICNKELGTPFDRCSRVFENAVLDCNAALGPMFNWLCSLTYIVQSVCYIVKPFDLVCVIVDFISNSVIGVVIKKVKTFIRHIKTMFYVRIKFSHSFHFETNATKTLGEISSDIVAEVKDRTKGLQMIFDFITSASTIFFLFIIFKVCHYRYKFLTSDQFDNQYINKDFVFIDLKRAQIGRETVLPLSTKEAKKYVRTNSLKLIEKEKKELSKSLSTLGVASVKLAIHMAADYCLYWILNLIKYYAKFQSKVKAPNMPMVFVKGDGFLADLLKSVVKAFQPLGLELEIDTIPCLPTPIPPDFDRYVQIAILLGLCWILTVLEPYGLRFRNIIMCYYYPLRGKQRAIWLYNNILRKRSSFLKFARRQLRRKFFGSQRISKVTCKEFLIAKFRCLGFCFGTGEQIACVLCGEIFRESDDVKPIRCQTPGCQGIYCERCFADLQNLCTLCLSPVEYGDLSDISEERDSSDEDEEKKKKPKKISSKQQGGKDDDDNDDDGNDDDHRKNVDSDYSSGELTEYSYTYQDERKSLSIIENDESAQYFKDVEKQHIPDYASMDSFRTSEDDNVKHETDIIDILAPRNLESDSSSSDTDKSKVEQEKSLQKSKSKIHEPLATSTPYKKSNRSKSFMKRRKMKRIFHEKRKNMEEKMPLLNQSSDTDYEENDIKYDSSLDSDIEMELDNRIKKRKNSFEKRETNLQNELKISNHESHANNSENKIEADSFAQSRSNLDIIDKSPKKEADHSNTNEEEQATSSTSSFEKDESRNTHLYQISQLVKPLNEYSYVLKKFQNNVTLENTSETSKSNSSSLDESLQDIIKAKNQFGNNKSKKVLKRYSFESQIASTNRSQTLRKKRFTNYYKALSEKQLNEAYSVEKTSSNGNRFIKWLQKICRLFVRKKETLPVTSQDYELSSYNYSENTWNTFNEDTSLIQLTDNSEISSEVPQHSEDSVRNIPVNYSFSINYSPAVRKNSFNITQFTSPNIFENPNLTLTEKLNLHMSENLTETSNKPIIIRAPAEKENSAVPLKRTEGRSLLDIQELQDNISNTTNKSYIESRKLIENKSVESVPEIRTEITGQAQSKTKSLIEKLKAHQKTEIENSFDNKATAEFGNNQILDTKNTSESIYYTPPSSEINQIKITKTIEKLSAATSSKEKQSTENKNNKTDVQTSTNNEQLNSKLVQVCEDEIDFYNSVNTNCSCVKLHNKENLNKMHCCDCCPERDESYANRPYSQQRNQGQMSKKFNERDILRENFTTDSIKGKKDNCTQTAQPQNCSMKCNCHCGDFNNFYDQQQYNLKARRNPICYCQSDDEDEYYNDNLQYQNRDDYYELVQELEDTLVNRNRNRVRRAMHEFEQRSRMNRPLERPITNYDEPSGSEECVLRKLTLVRTSNKPKERCQCRCGRNVPSCNHISEQKWSRSPRVCDQREHCPNNNEHIVETFQKCRPNHCPKKTHWKLNPRTGEWFKVDENFACQPFVRSHKRSASSPRTVRSDDTEYFR